MTDRELRRLSRAALIELLIMQMEENQKLEEQLDALRLQLAGEDFEAAEGEPLPKSTVVTSGAVKKPRDGETKKRSEPRKMPEPVVKVRVAAPTEPKPESVSEEAGAKVLTEEDLAILRGIAAERPAKRPKSKAKDPFGEALSAFRENNQ